VKGSTEDTIGGLRDYLHQRSQYCMGRDAVVASEKLILCLEDRKHQLGQATTSNGTTWDKKAMTIIPCMTLVTMKTKRGTHTFSLISGGSQRIMAFIEAHSQSPYTL